MEAINILRLKTGEDIIGYVEQYDNEGIIVREPMMVMVRTDYKSGKQNIGMDYWLPIGLLKHNETVLRMRDVLAVLIPNAEFTEYYEHTVGTLQNIRNNVKEEPTSSNDEVLTQEDMSLILNSLDPNNIKVVH